jgi:hypothetical protein
MGEIHMTDTSAGLTRYGSDWEGGMQPVPSGDYYLASEADALLADLRGKHALAMNEAQQAINFWMAAKDEFEKQLEAERAKVRELSAGIKQWARECSGCNGTSRKFVYVSEITGDDVHDDCDQCAHIRALLPASVDAKGDAECLRGG